MSWTRRLMIGVAVLLLILAAAAAVVSAHRAQGARVPAMALVVPAGTSASDPRIRVWVDAAREEGIDLRVLDAEHLLRPMPSQALEQFAGIVLPDGVHARASPNLIGSLERYVKDGGNLMVVYDAATQTGDGFWYRSHAPLSTLVGIDYALYDDLKDKSFKHGPVLLDSKSRRDLAIPPGKTVKGAFGADDASEALSAYHYGQLTYAYFATRGRYDGQALARSADGDLLAGVRRVEAGSVLFVNLALGYLKGQTDGLPLHAFLRYFANNVARLPVLMPTPQGKGGLIFNWHIDSGAALRPIQKLESIGLLDQGPFSVHFTAGPDTYREGDGAGLDLRHNKELVPWIQRFRDRGYALGSHGGWIHNYFGENVSETNQGEMTKYLEWNDAAVREAAGGAVLEYSAPVGNQPLWVTDWLEAHGYLGYYFTGNSGMAPTRSYRDGILRSQRIWSFPISVLGPVASFEEASEAGISEEEMTAWLDALTDFSVETGTVRLFYSHPTGWDRYNQAIKRWFEHTRQLGASGDFRWYTMSAIAVFLDRREQVSWRSSYDEHHQLVIEASHPVSLSGMTWRLPRTACVKPLVESGAADLRKSADAWFVAATGGASIRVLCQLSEKSS